MFGKQLTGEEIRRENQRLALASHAMNADMISWDREGHASFIKLAMKALWKADIMLALHDKYPEGTIDQTTI